MHKHEEIRKEIRRIWITGEHMVNEQEFIDSIMQLLEKHEEDLDNKIGSLVGYIEYLLKKHPDEEIQAVADEANEYLTKKEGMKSQNLEPFNKEIQVCPKCHQVDAYKDDGHPCDPEYQEQRALSNEYYE